MTSKLLSVGSENPVKLNAAVFAFSKVFPDIKFKAQSVAVESGVSNQPMSDEEAIRGAINRATRSLKLVPAAHYGIGMEGGVMLYDQTWFDCGWIAVIDADGHIGLGSTGRMIVPPQMMNLILNQHLELGEAVDIVFKVKNAKQNNGHFGLMTNNAIDRQKAYENAVIFALARFIHPELF